MKIIFRTQGFSLVEIIVALALIGLIATAFFPLITYSYKNIYSVGNDDKSLYQLQQKMENSSAWTEINTDGINIEFTNGTIIKVPGSTYSIQQNASGRQLTIIYFQPDEV